MQYLLVSIRGMHQANIYLFQAYMYVISTYMLCAIAARAIRILFWVAARSRLISARYIARVVCDVNPRVSRCVARSAAACHRHAASATGMRFGVCAFSHRALHAHQRR